MNRRKYESGFSCIPSKIKNISIYSTEGNIAETRVTWISGNPSNSTPYVGNNIKHYNRMEKVLC